MFPVIRLVFAALGALLGANIGLGAGWFLPPSSGHSSDSPSPN
jgi:hypothetical protein